MSSLNSNLSSALDILKNIQTEDREIQNDLDAFRKRVKKMKKPSFHTLFFMSKKRSLKYYAWWDAENEEAIIYNYEI